MKKEKWYLNRSLIISVIIGSFFFFYGQTKNRKPVYFVEHGVPLISEKQEEIGLNLFFENKKIQGPVSMANLYFWNAGDIPIERDDILDHIIIIVLH